MTLAASWLIQLPDGTEHRQFGEFRAGYLADYGCVTVGIGCWADGTMTIVDPRAIISHVLLGVVYTPRLYPLDQHQDGVAEWLEANPEWGVFEIERTKKAKERA